MGNIGSEPQKKSQMCEKMSDTISEKMNDSKEEKLSDNERYFARLSHRSGAFSSVQVFSAVFSCFQQSSSAFISVQVLSEVFTGFQATSFANVTKQKWSHSSSTKYFELSFQSPLRLFSRVQVAYRSQFQSLLISFPSPFGSFYYCGVHYFSLHRITMISMRREKVFACEMIQKHMSSNSTDV